MASVDTGAIEGEIAHIRLLALEDLRREWRWLNHSDPPKISRDPFRSGLASNGPGGPTPSLSLKPGARLVREWRSRTHTVTVTEDGFEYAGANYPSLTQIARRITGAHWSGPRFFGLLAAGAERASNGARDW
jgi:hypothetical protein